MSLVRALKEFGFNVPALEPALFLGDHQIVRIGHPQLRVEIMTSASGVDFASCYDDPVEDKMGGVEATIISLACLKKNKRASGRHKDLNDLENLP